MFFFFWTDLAVFRYLPDTHAIKMFFFYVVSSNGQIIESFQKSPNNTMNLRKNKGRFYLFIVMTYLCRDSHSMLDKYLFQIWTIGNNHFHLTVEVLDWGAWEDYYVKLTDAWAAPKGRVFFRCKQVKSFLSGLS